MSEKSGQVNFYIYTSNNSVNLIDPLGLIGAVGTRPPLALKKEVL